jgi:hypothetical protein
VWGWEGCECGRGGRVGGGESKGGGRGGCDGERERGKSGERRGGREEETLNVRLLVQFPYKNHNRGEMQAF